MIQYFDNGDLACIDGLSFRRDKKTGYFLSSKKIDGTRKRLHVYVWESANGVVPDGYEIHHADKNKANNELPNLQLLTAEEHRKIHSVYDEVRREKARKNLLENATEKAKAWHSSPEGKAWHSKHAKEIQANMQEREYTCTFCGRKFKSKKNYSENENRFCCNSCKSAYRRETGADDVEKICKECGGKYIENKYRKTEKCPRCRHKKH